MRDMTTHTKTLLAVIAVASWLGVLGCTRDIVVPYNRGDTDETTDGCATDEECGAGKLCVFQDCVDEEYFTCGTDMLPLINVKPLNIELGEVPLNQSAEAKVTIESIGNCNLNLLGVNVKDGSAPGFSCSPCDFTSYPKMLAPHRTFEITVKYTAMTLGEALGNLVIRSDDRSAGHNGDVDVELHAAYSGKPVLVVEPASINFGFVPYTAGQGGESRTGKFKIMNKGTGNAGLKVDFLYLVPGSDFSMPSQYEIRPQTAKILPPYDANNPATYLEIPITFSPTRNANQKSSVIIVAGGVEAQGAPATCATSDDCPAGYSCDGSSQCVGDDYVVDLAASSLGPAKITINPTELTFKTIAGEPLSIGMTAYQQVNINNPGQSELEVDLSLLNDNNGEFTYSPSYLAPIAPGGNVALGVFYAPSAPSDPQSPGAPTVATKAVLQILAKNADPMMNTIKLNGWAASSLGDDVLKLDLTFDNANGGWANNDFRNVDIQIESPLGMICSKPRAIWSPNGQGGWLVSGSDDYCKAWNDTQLEGHVTWLSMSASEEPERILMYGLGPDYLACDSGVGCHGTFKVNLSYSEDCANIPKGIVADLIGIGSSALLGILGGAIGVPITVNPDSISNLISENCWDTKSTLATVQIYINGTEVAAPAVRLNKKGDVATVAHIERRNGAFTVLP